MTKEELILSLIWMEQNAVGFDLPPEEIIEHLCRDNRLLQSAYDKLKQRIDDAETCRLYKVDGVFMMAESNKRYPNGELVDVALVELPEEMDGKK